MSETFSKLQYVYIEDGKYDYPPTNQRTASEWIETGWHMLPNQLLSHFLTPTEIWSLINKAEAFHVSSCSITVCNMIPLTETLAIQGNSTFSAFNNTIYALGYRDSIYETNWFSWSSARNNFNIAYKEGALNQDGTWARMNLPTFRWLNMVPSRLQANRSGVFWDPLNRAHEIMELRPGKNAIQFSWSAHPSDSDKWYNTDFYLYHSNIDKPSDLGGRDDNASAYYPYQKPDRGDPNREHPDGGVISTAPNMNWWHATPSFENDIQINMWRQAAFKIQENEQSATINKFGRALTFWNNLADGRYSWRYPITQWFIKMVPLYNEESNLIKTSAQICLQKQMTIDIKPRHTALYSSAISQENNSMFDISEAAAYVPPSVMRGRSGGLPPPTARKLDEYPWTDVPTPTVRNYPQ